RPTTKPEPKAAPATSSSAPTTPTTVHGTRRRLTGTCPFTRRGGAEVESTCPLSHSQARSQTINYEGLGKAPATGGLRRARFGKNPAGVPRAGPQGWLRVGQKRLQRDTRSSTTCPILAYARSRGDVNTL